MTMTMMSNALDVTRSYTFPLKADSGLGMTGVGSSNADCLLSSKYLL